MSTKKFFGEFALLVNHIQTVQLFLFNHIKRFLNNYELIQEQENLAKYSNNGNSKDSVKVENIRLSRSGNDYISKALKRNVFYAKKYVIRPLK